MKLADHLVGEAAIFPTTSSKLLSPLGVLALEVGLPLRFLG